MPAMSCFRRSTLIRLTTPIPEIEEEKIVCWKTEVLKCFPWRTYNNLFYTGTAEKKNLFSQEWENLL